jgi:hypothetical protein
MYTGKILKGTKPADLVFAKDLVKLAIAVNEPSARR